MRSAFIALLCIAACSDAVQAPSPPGGPLPPDRPQTRPAPRPVVFTPPFTETPTLDEAVAFGAIPTAPLDSWRVRAMNVEGAADYVVTYDLPTEMAGYRYLWQRRRNGDWIADHWRYANSQQIGASYFNVRSGVAVHVEYDLTGNIDAAQIEQDEDEDEYRLIATGEYAAHLGERCEIWRALPNRLRGTVFLNESCITADGIELYGRRVMANHPRQPDRELGRVNAASISRQNASGTRPPAEVFDLAYWRSRAANDAATPSNNTPPDHSIWFERQREVSGGYVTLRQYRSGAHSRLSHGWHGSHSGHDYWLETPGLTVHARHYAGIGAIRQLSFRLGLTSQYWRPDSSTIIREPTPLTVLGRQCYWLTPLHPPHDGWSRDCWTDDNLILASEHESRGNGSGEAAVRLTVTPPRALEPPREILSWAQEMRE